ncbi:Heterokaryon incompatibility protein (HET) domain containing protein [Hyaloscypha variabilis]
MLTSELDEANDHLRPFFHKSYISMNSISSDGTFNKIRTLLLECESNHSTCNLRRSQDLPNLPNRVLEILTEGEELAIRLHISESEERGSYAALSYCWGGPQRFTLKTMTLNSMIRGIPLTILPRTILDAITVTRKLGMRFLWVDSLCIIQDSAEDKIHEISEMGDIYKNSSITIVAANARTVEDGFLLERPPPELCPIPIQLGPNVSGTAYVDKYGFDSHTDEFDEPLFKRGWAFQEFFLSPKILLYDSIQVTFTCLSHSFKGVHSNLAEYNYSAKPELSKVLYSFNKEAFNERDYFLRRDWTELISKYSAREFTNFEDRLPAIAGIAKIISQKWNEDYVAGIWRRFLVHQLAWYERSGSLQYNQRSGASPNEPFAHIKERIGWPSWSWKTAPFAVGFSYIEVDAQVLDHEVKLASQDAPFGDVLEATLTLKAKIFPFRRELLEDPKNDGDLILDSESTTDSSSWVLLLGRTFNYAQFLVVREGEDNCFERIGILWDVAKPQNIFKQDWDTVVARTVILR